MKVKERLAADNLGFQGEEVISRNSNQVISFDNNDNFSDIGQNSGTKPSSFNNIVFETSSTTGILRRVKNGLIHHIILDCCGWNYIDDSAAKLLIVVDFVFF